MITGFNEDYAEGLPNSEKEFMKEVRKVMRTKPTGPWLADAVRLGMKSRKMVRDKPIIKPVVPRP